MEGLKFEYKIKHINSFQQTSKKTLKTLRFESNKLLRYFSIYFIFEKHLHNKLYFL